MDIVSKHEVIEKRKRYLTDSEAGHRTPPKVNGLDTVIFGPVGLSGARDCSLSAVVPVVAGWPCLSWYKLGLEGAD